MLDGALRLSRREAIVSFREFAGRHFSAQGAVVFDLSTGSQSFWKRLVGLLHPSH